MLLSSKTQGFHHAELCRKTDTALILDITKIGTTWNKPSEYVTHFLAGERTYHTTRFHKSRASWQLQSLFITKIGKIGNHINISATSVLDSWWFLTPQDIAKIILSSSSKRCESDPIPTDLLKAILPVILHLFTELLNRLLQRGTFPNDLKEALVKLLLKKITLELIDKNYHPVSNLPFIVKKQEWAATNQFMDHIHQHNLMEPLQSAYRPDHKQTFIKS